MKTIKVFTAFSGYDSQMMALNRVADRHKGEIDFELVGWSEIDKYAIKAHDLIFPQYKDRNYGDISNIDWSQVPDFDLFTYSFPCFTAGTLVLTKDGFKEIQDISESDEVITHTNQFRKVVKQMVNGYKGDLYHINAMAFHGIDCTPEHPFYVRKRYRKWDNTNRRQQRLFEEPAWINAKDLTKEHYLGIAINQKESLPEWNGVEDNRWGHHKNSNTLSRKFNWLSFWYVMGRYVGDGWKRTSESSKGIVICCGGRNEEKLVDALNACEFKYHATKERTVTKYHICCKELHDFVGRYGYYAHGKRIDAETMNLPRPLLGWFLQGYFDADGNLDGILHKATSVSKELIYGVGQCVAKVYQVPYKIYRTTRKPKTIIEGRTVNQRDTYQIVFKKRIDKQDKAFYEDGYIWFPIKSITTEYAECPVYNMEVETDNSYTANGCIVHNCTDISNAGLQKGLYEGSGTRSSLLWECRKAIIAKKPKYLLLENVKALVSKKFIAYFNKWCYELGEYGYYNYWRVMNAKDYGVPQNRERVFLLSIRKDIDNSDFIFPKEFELTTCLKDVLEETVDEKYYLSEKSIEGFLAHNENHEKKEQALYEGQKI